MATKTGTNTTTGGGTSNADYYNSLTPEQKKLYAEAQALKTTSATPDGNAEKTADKGTTYGQNYGDEYREPFLGTHADDGINDAPMPTGGELPLLEASKLGRQPGMPGVKSPEMYDSDALLGQYELPEAPQRTVTDDELASSQLNKLLDSNSKYMRQARLEGLELGGGLGGTVGIQAAYGEAIRRGGPLAIADAQAYRDAATQNMDSLIQFGLANIQRTTQIQLGAMDANTRLTTTAMNNTTSQNIALLNSITQRDIAQLTADTNVGIANLDARTKVRITELNGEIQKRLADDAFKHSQILNDQLHGGRLEEIALTGEYALENTLLQNEANDQTNYMNAYLQGYDSTLNRIESLNGIEMDDAARARAIDAIWEGWDGYTALISALYPDVEPIEFE